MLDRIRTQRQSGLAGCCALRNERGVVLTTSLILLAVLSLIGATAILTTITDTKIATNFEHHTRAFYQAEAGINYTLARLPELIADGSLLLNGTLATETLTPPITAPAGFSFDPIATFTRVGAGPNYQFQSTGRVGTSRVTLDMVVRHGGGATSYGFFGNQMVELQEASEVFSYDSETTPNPTLPDDFTQAGNVGANGTVTIHHTVLVDGYVQLGADASGNPGSYSVTGDPTEDPSVIEWPPPQVDRINPDPLGAINGALADEISALRNNNDNSHASLPINGDVTLNAGDHLILTSGNYYLNSVTLNAFSRLEFDSSSGTINIYLEGGFKAKANSFIEYTSATALPTDFAIYSNAATPITLRHFGDFKGMIYAPYATVEIANTSTTGGPRAYGLVWSQNGVLHNRGLFYFDTALKTKLLTSGVAVVSWKENHN